MRIPMSQCTLDRKIAAAVVLVLTAAKEVLRSSDEVAPTSTGLDCLHAYYTEGLGLNPVVQVIIHDLICAKVSLE